MIGPPPPVPSGKGSEHGEHHVGQRVATSQSTMAMQSLVDSTSMEPINTWAGGNRNMHNRSISEPDFGRTPRQVRILFQVHLMFFFLLFMFIMLDK